MGKSAPKPPDPQKTASAQTSSNIGTAVANGYLGNINQITPHGSLTYSQTGTNAWTDPNSGKTYDLPQITAEQTFTPKGQRINDANMGAQINMAELARDQSRRLKFALGEEFSTKGIPGVWKDPKLDRTIDSGGKIERLGFGPDLTDKIAGAGNITKTYGTDFSKDRQRVERALMERMQPGLERDRNALEDRLASQGINIGSAAYRNAMDDYSRQVNGARLEAVLAGGQEQSRMTGLEANRAAFENQAQSQQFGQNATRAGFANDANQQEFQNDSIRVGANNQAQAQQFGQNAQRTAFANNTKEAQVALQQRIRDALLQEQYALRGQPINEIAALMSGTQVQQPNFVNAQGPQAATTDYAGIVNNNYAQQMGAYNARQQGTGGFMGGIGSLIGAGIQRWG